MNFNGSYNLNANINDVWRNLNDPKVLKICIDGCKEFEKINKNHYKAKIIIKLGPVHATFNSLIRIYNIVEKKIYDI